MVIFILIILGRRFGLKHSPEIAREISKDTILGLILLVSTIVMINDYRQRDTVESIEWRNYYYGELKNKRDNIPV